MNNRQDIKDFIQKIEKHFPLNNWKIEGFCIWPLLRIKISFYLIEKLENPIYSYIESNKGAKRNFLLKLKNRLSITYKAIQFIVWKNKLKQKKFLFAGFDAHRVDFKNTRYNRFYDPLIEDYKLENESNILEYIYSEKEINYAKNNIHYIKGLALYKSYSIVKNFFFKRKKTNTTNWDNYDEFYDQLTSSGYFCNNFLYSINHKQYKKYLTESWLPLVDFHTLLLQKTKPKKLFILCYYGAGMMALLAAGNRLNIDTFDLQHGAQMNLHFAYFNWSLQADEKYELLPKYFWCWDEQSEQTLNKWTSKNCFHETFIGGNTWVEYWKKLTFTYPYKDFILYALQPNPVLMDQLFHQNIINVIKSSKERWFLRLHPRQFNQKDEILKLLKQHNLSNRVNLEDATNDPLPLLLQNCKLNITHFSGTTIEASLFNKKTILLNKIGLQSFENLINQNKAFYIDYTDSDFLNKFTEIVSDKNLKNNMDVILSNVDEAFRKTIFKS